MAWGSRGTLLAIALFYLINLLKRGNWLLLIVLLLLIVISWDLIMLVLENIVYMVADITGARKIESLIRLASGEAEMLEASSGRDVLYMRSIQLFKENPFGCGVGYWSEDPVMNGLYPHNIFLQVATEFGVIGLVSLLTLIAVVTIRLFRLDEESFAFGGMLFAIAIGRLLISSSYWERPEFWLLLGAFVFNSKTTIKLRDEKE